MWDALDLDLAWKYDGMFVLTLRNKLACSGTVLLLAPLLGSAVIDRDLTPKCASNGDINGKRFHIGIQNLHTTTISILYRTSSRHANLFKARISTPRPP